MTETRFQTAHLPPEHRLEQWREITSKALMPTECVSDVSDFLADLNMLELGSTQIASIRLPKIRSVRSAKQIKVSDPEQFQLAVPVRGSYRFRQAGRETQLGPGDLMLYDSSRPFDSWTWPSESDQCHMIVVQFPRRLLPVSPDKLNPLVAVRSVGDSGMGAVISSYIRNLTHHQVQLRPTDASRLGGVTLDLFSAWCAIVMDNYGPLPLEARERALRASIHSFIEQHLAEPDLSPDVVAAAHHISTRYLHRLFCEEDKTVAAWIRQRRLERCRRDLSDPALRARPVHAIAGRWGFNNKSHFSRLFRATYGFSPTEFRHQL